MIKKSILTPWTLALFTAFLLFSCQPDTIQEPYTGDEKAQTEQLSFKNLTNTKPILADNESRDILYTRSFNVRNPLYATPASDATIKIISYSPQAISNITIYAKLKNVPERIKLFTLDYIDPLTEFEYKVPFVQDTPSFYKTESGKWVEISGMASIGNVIFSIDSPDPLFVKLKNLKPNWNIKFNMKGGTDWYDMNPVHCREQIVMFTNMAYLFSNEEWQSAFLAYEGLYGNDGVTLLTKTDKENLIKNIISRSYFNTGLVKGVNGLGGGNTLGVAEYVLLYQYTENWASTFFHELGHCLDYSHDSNMTYPNKDNGTAFYNACLPTFNKLLRTKELPYWNYKTLNTLYKYRGVPGTLIETPANKEINYQNY